MRILLCATAVLLLFASPATATSRFFRDLSAKSTNGQFLAEAKSPANREPNRPMPFQKDFTIALTGAKANKTLWSWQQGTDDSSPVELIPTDDGYLVVLDAWNNYNVFSAKGAKTTVFNVLDSLPKDEKERFTNWTTAGVMWQQYSQRGFVTYERKSYFYIRLYWGKTFILDVHNAKLEASPELAQHVEQLVLRQTRTLIESLNGEYYAQCDSCGGSHLRSDLVNAVFVVKKHNIPEGQMILNEVLKRTDDHRNSDLKRYLDRIGNPSGRSIWSGVGEKAITGAIVGGILGLIGYLKSRSKKRASPAPKGHDTGT